MKPPHDARLVPAALAAWACAAAAGFGTNLWYISIAAILLAGTCAAVRSAWAPSAGVAVVAALFAAWSGSARADVHELSALVGAEGTPATVTGTVSSLPVQYRGTRGEQWRLGLHATEVVAGAQAGAIDPRGSAVSGIEVIAFVSNDHVDVSPANQAGARSLHAQDLRVDDVVTLTGPLSADGVMWDAQVVSVTSPQSAVTHVREVVVDATGRLAVNDAAMVRGMLLGDTSSMPAPLKNAMRTAGLAHLTAVSGAHFAVVTSLVASVLAWVRMPRRARVIVLGAALGAFALLVGPAPSVWRAGALVVATVLGLWWGRPARGLAALACGVIALMVAVPGLAVQWGFAMSVTAVAAIVLWAPRVAFLLSRWVPPRLAQASAVAVTAQWAVTPWLIAFQPALLPFAVVANLLVAIWIVPVMACGIVALAVATWWPAGAEACIVAAGWASRPIAATALWVADIPGASLAFPTGLWGAGLALTAVAGAIVATTTRHVLRWAGAWIALASCVAGVMAARPGASAPSGWDIVACDVGQGDMTLVRAGPRAAVVIDTGRTSAQALECLQRFDVHDVPLLVLTHPHADHDGAAAAIADAAPVRLAWVSEPGRRSASGHALETRGVPVVVPPAGAAVQVGDATVEVISTWHADEESAWGLNDSSVVVVASTAQASVLALGDLEPPAQAAIVDHVPVATLTAVKVAHHGSAHQDASLAEAIDARVAIVSVGSNTYGHPAPETLALYAHHVGAVLRTDRCGDIALDVTDRGALEVSSECRTDMAR